MFLASKNEEINKETDNIKYKDDQDISTDVIRVLDITSEITSSNISKFNTKGHSGDIISMVSTPDEKRLITASSDKTINIYALEDKKLLHTYHKVHDEYITVILIIDYETLLSGGEDNRIIKWDLRLQKINENHLDVENKNKSENEDKCFKIFKENCHVDMVCTLAYCKKYKKLISGGKTDHFIKIWDYEKQILIGEIDVHRQRIAF